jgi:hypothetical protein
MRKTIAILLLASLAGCDLEAEAEADRVCVTEPAAFTVPGQPVQGSFTFPTPNLRLRFDAALPDLNEQGVEADLIATSISLVTAQNVDLSGIQRASVTIAASGANPAVTFVYDRPAGAAAPITRIEARPTARVDLVDYVDGTNSIAISQIQVEGTAPSSAWTPSFETCGSSKVTVDYVKASGG